MHNGLIFINVDDEVNIKSMHTLIFSRLKIKLKCCTNQIELIQTLIAIHSYRLHHKVDPKVIVLLDHILDGQTGLELLECVKKYEHRLNLEINWVLVSSTEDESTISKYKKAGVQQCIQKPLSIHKIKDILDK